MDLRRYSDATAFLDAAGGFLAKREAEHNLMLGISANLREMPEIYTAPPYLATVSAGDRIVLAAIQTPPFQLVISQVDDPAAIPILAADTMSRNLHAAIGPVGVIEPFDEARRALGAAPGHVHMSERIFRLSHVIPPAPVPGGIRRATAADRDLALAWIQAFFDEAFDQHDEPDVPGLTDRWLAGRGRALYLWDHGGPVSMCGIGSPTPNGIRIGPVYTPPGFRARGYASALVARVSQDALDSGRRFCFLLTDLANPTSNHIYQTIGYEPVGDLAAFRFTVT